VEGWRNDLHEAYTGKQASDKGVREPLKC
jgi:hypothetical protein